MIKHWNILKLQNYAFIGFTCFTFLLFLATIVFSTSYYNSYLYGNEELVEFYTNELQSFNQQAFIFCIVLVLLFVVCRLFQPKKYYPTFITFPIYVVVLLIGIILGILIVVQMQEIIRFYQSYDFTGISKLEDFTGNSFFPILLMFSSIGLAVVNTISLVIYSFGFWKFIKGRGEAYA